MKKILLSGLLVLGLAFQSCYKKDLDQANLTIVELTQQINSLNNELKIAIQDNNTKAEALKKLQSQIELLNDEIYSLQGVNEELLNKISNLENEINDLNNKISELQSQLNDAISQISLLDDSLESSESERAKLTALIQSLTQQIAELEAREPEVIIEYVEVVEYITQYVSTGISQSTVDSLNQEIESLKQQIQDLSAPQPPVITQEGTNSSYGLVISWQLYNNNELHWQVTGDINPLFSKVELTIFKEILDSNSFYDGASPSSGIYTDFTHGIFESGETFSIYVRAWKADGSLIGGYGTLYGAESITLN